MHRLRKRHLWMVYLLVFWCWGVERADAEDGDAALSDAIQLYQNGEWELSAERLDRLLTTVPLTQGQRTRALQTLAEAYISLKQYEKAVMTYKRIVREDRSFNLRSLGENPDAILLKHLGQALLEVRDEDLKAREVQLRRTSRGQAFLRSTVLPGWGQRYQGYRGRGYIMLSLTAASIGYAAFAEWSYRDARNAYREGLAGADFGRLYEDYTDKANRANWALGIVGAAWLLNTIDAVILGPNITRPQADLRLAPAGLDGLQVVYRKRF